MLQKTHKISDRQTRRRRVNKRMRIHLLRPNKRRVKHNTNLATNIRKHRKRRHSARQNPKQAHQNISIRKRKTSGIQRPRQTPQINPALLKTGVKPVRLLPLPPSRHKKQILDMRPGQLAAQTPRVLHSEKRRMARGVPPNPEIVKQAEKRVLAGAVAHGLVFLPQECYSHKTRAAPAAARDFCDGILSAMARTIYIVFSGFCALLVTMGLARFSFATLIPLAIEAGWFSETQTYTLGVGNLFGYLAGALLASFSWFRVPSGAAIRASLCVAALSFFACSRPGEFAWFAFFLFAGGMTSGVVLVLAMLNVQSRTPPPHHALIGGILVSGMGGGLILSGLLVPLLSELSLTTVWLGLGVTCLALTGLTWAAWSDDTRESSQTETATVTTASARTAAETAPAITATTATMTAAETVSADSSVDSAVHRLVVGSYISYSLSSLSLAMPQVLFIDFVVRELGYGMSTGGLYWQMMGAGAIFGSLCFGRFADRFGRGFSYRVALLALGVTLLVPIASVNVWVLGVMSFCIGVFNFAQVGVLAARLRALLGGDEVLSRRVWARASFLFGLFQAAGSAFYVWLLVTLGGYEGLFLLAGGFALLGGVVEFSVARRHGSSELPVCP